MPDGRARRGAAGAAAALALALIAGCTPAATAPSPAPTTSPAAPAPPTQGAEPVVRFVVGSDGHWGQAGTDWVRFYSDFVAAVNAVDAQTPLDFVALVGDLTNEDADLLPEAKRALGGLNAPLIATRGNNDFGTKKQWRAVFGADPNTVTSIAGTLFVLADTTDGHGSKDCPDARWIERQLANHPDAASAFLFFHVPPVDPATLELSCDRLQRLLADEPRIKAIFNGHVHALDTVVRVGDVPYLFDGHLGSSNGVDYRGFRVVEVGADGTLRTWTTDGARRLNEVTLPLRG